MENMDLLLQRMCAECCTIIEDLYGTNPCGHLTFCFECGRKLAVTCTPCTECGVPLTSLIKEYKVRPYKQQLEGGQEATYYKLFVKGMHFVSSGSRVWYHDFYDSVKNLEKPLTWKEAWDLHFNPSRKTVDTEKKTDEIRTPPPTAVVKRKFEVDVSRDDFESKRSKPESKGENAAPVKKEGDDSKSKRSKPDLKVRKGEKGATVKARKTLIAADFMRKTPSALKKQIVIADASRDESESKRSKPESKGENAAAVKAKGAAPVAVPKQSGGSDLDKKANIALKTPIARKPRTALGKRTIEADASIVHEAESTKSKVKSKVEKGEKGALLKTKGAVPVAVSKQSGDTRGADPDKKARKTSVTKPPSAVKKQIVRADASKDEKESKKSKIEAKVEKGKKAILVDKKRVVKRTESPRKPHGGKIN